MTSWMLVVKNKKNKMNFIALVVNKMIVDCNGLKKYNFKLP